MSRPQRELLIAGNWKMNHGPRETAKFFAEFRAEVNALMTAGEAGSRLRLVIFPPAVSLETAAREAAVPASPVPVAIGAQNAHWEQKGAFTGEISGSMLLEMGLSWSLTGHSERRQYFGETDEVVRRKTESLLAQGLRVVLCIGETRAEREAGRTAEILTTQLAGALPEKNVGAAKYLDGRLVIAYEPVWAIGTGLTATPDQAEEAHRLVRNRLAEQFGAEAAERTSILYGGSVTPENVDALLACPNVDGALVGGASLKAESYAKLAVAGARAVTQS